MKSITQKTKKSIYQIQKQNRVLIRLKLSKPDNGGYSVCLKAKNQYPSIMSLPDQQV